MWHCICFYHPAITQSYIIKDEKISFTTIAFSAGFLLAQSAMSLDDCIRLAYKQNPAVRNGVIGIKETKADYIASVGAFLPHIVVNAETGKRFGRSLDPDTNGYTSESFEEERWDLI